MSESDLEAIQEGCWVWAVKPTQEAGQVGVVPTWIPPGGYKYRELVACKQKAGWGGRKGHEMRGHSALKTWTPQIVGTGLWSSKARGPPRQ